MEDKQLGFGRGEKYPVCFFYLYVLFLQRIWVTAYSWELQWSMNLEIYARNTCTVMQKFVLGIHLSLLAGLNSVVWTQEESRKQAQHHALWALRLSMLLLCTFRSQNSTDMTQITPSTWSIFCGNCQDTVRKLMQPVLYWRKTN